MRVPGASDGGHTYTTNEDLHAAAVRRMLKFDTIPYFLCVDCNINPNCSECLRMRTDAGNLVDIVNEWSGCAPPPTFRTFEDFEVFFQVFEDF